MEDLEDERVELLLDNLEALGFTNYTSQLQDVSSFRDAVLNNGADSQIFRDLTAELINQIINLDDQIDSGLMINGKSKNEFHKGVESFTHSQSYPYNLDATPKSLLTLLEWLVAELQAEMIIAANQPGIEASTPSASSSSSSPPSLSIDIPEIPAFTFSEQIIFTQKLLQLPPQSPSQTLDSAKIKINELTKLLPNYIKSPIFKRNSFTKEQIDTLTQINNALQIEYKFRHEVLRKRLGVTLQGFLWSELGKEKEVEIRSVIQSRVSSIPPSPAHDLYDLFAAHTDMLDIKKTSSFATGLENPSRRSVIVGNVPDRGGRVNVKKGVTDMPSLKPREELSGQKQQRKGGRVQGSWSGNNDNNNNNNNNNNEKGNWGGKGKGKGRKK